MSILREHEEQVAAADQRAWDQYGSTLELLINLKSAVALAIDAIQDRERLKADRDYWKNQYMELLNHDIKHGDEMLGNMLKMVVECDIKPRAEKP